jgi:ATP-dependent exoDNAse (exonuclease V) beta subunit
MSQENSRPTRHSYSSISTYEHCPAQYKFSYIERRDYPESPAMLRGTRLHQMAEDFVTGTVDSIHFDVQKIGPTLQMLKSQGAKAEEVWMLDSMWLPTANKDEARTKAIIDVHYVLEEVVYLKDYKSGQMYDNHRDQLEFYGVLALHMYPTAKRVETSALYIDTGHEGMQSSIIRAMIPKMRQKWEDKIIIIEKDEAFEPKPGFQCRGCPYAKGKGGPCLY